MTIKDLLGDIANELAGERAHAMTPEEKQLHAIAQKLLLLERDLRTPGTARPEDVRVERLLEIIEHEAF